MSNNNVDTGKIKDELHNYTEDIVLETMENLLEDEEFKDICTCKQCLLDIATYSLNQLPGKYTATHFGNLITKIKNYQQQTNVDLISVITKAIKLVSENPNH
ncbi:MAG: late competence development ComFB family protein [Halanaerobiales bacterium]